MNSLGIGHYVFLSLFDVLELLVCLVRSNLECLCAVKISLLYNSGEKGFSDRFCGLVCCIVKMMFAVKMVNNKVVELLHVSCVKISEQ